MKKRYVMIGVIGILLLICGICYSCTYKREENGVELISSLQGSELKSSQTELLNDAASQKGTVKAEELVSPKDMENTLASTDAITQVTGEEKANYSFVHICGEVLNPGVYSVSRNARVIDLIELAGGLTKEAAGDYINQAQQVTDGQRIYIPNRDEVKDVSFITESLQDIGVGADNSSLERKININLADNKELMELPGVGEAKAAAILEYRKAHGSFETIEELMKIPGIKEGLFNKVSSYISVK